MITDLAFFSVLTNIINQWKVIGALLRIFYFGIGANKNVKKKRKAAHTFWSNLRLSASIFWINRSVYSRQCSWILTLAVREGIVELLDDVL